MMRKRSVLAVTCSCIVGAAIIFAAHEVTSAGAKSLPNSDYIEIQQLVARYPYAFDTRADNGYALADLFTPDGAFVYRSRTVKGRENLAAFVRGDSPQQGPLYAHIFSTNVIIEPSAEGAIGKAYVVSIDIGEQGKPGGIHGGGHYEDIYVKTQQGWRFKRREYVLSQSGDPSLSPR
jgi:uncharacterized protein (TIGR02246 family)